MNTYQEKPISRLITTRRSSTSLFSLRVASIRDLEKLHTELAVRKDTTIEFKPEAPGESSFRHMICNIPGNIRFEFIAG